MLGLVRYDRMQRWPNAFCYGCHASRYACDNGWCEVSMRGLRGRRGCDAALLLVSEAEQESVEIADKTVNVLTAAGFIVWLANKYCLRPGSARVAAV